MHSNLKELFDANGGMDKFEFNVLKTYLVCDKNHLHAYEQLWLNKYRSSCVNKKDTFGILKKFKKNQYGKFYSQEYKNYRQDYYQETTKPKLRKQKEIEYKEKTWFCDDCNHNYATKNKYNEHLKRTYHLLNVLPFSQVRREKERTFKNNQPEKICHYCKVSFKSVNEYEKHIESKTHLGVVKGEISPCRFCGKCLKKEMVHIKILILMDCITALRFMMLIMC
jgi:hypothetical protein